MTNTKCPPPDWFLDSFNEVLQQPSQERAEPWRDLRHRLLEHMGEFQRQPKATRTRQYLSNKRLFSDPKRADPFSDRAKGTGDSAQQLVKSTRHI